MALSFKEKRTLQQEIQIGFAELDKKPDFKTKRALQKRLADAFARLEGKIIGTTQSLLDQLLAGNFLKEKPLKFLNIIKNVLEELNGNIQPVREPVIAYLKAHHNAQEGVFESVCSGGDRPLNSHIAPFADDNKGKDSGAVRVTPKGLEYGAPRNITVDIDTDFDSPESFRGIIRAVEQAREVDTIILKINSSGGRTDTAQALYVALLETKAKTVARIITAYSSGSVVAMSCDEIQTTPHCTMMIHNASTMSWGKIGDMKAQSSFLEEHFKKWFAELYSGFLSPEEIGDVFKGQDIWLREDDIKKRLPNWKPIRVRRATEAQANNAE